MWPVVVVVVVCLQNEFYKTLRNLEGRVSFQTSV